MLLAGLRGFITGAGAGIGRAIALEMVREGADLAITDIDLTSAQMVAGEAQALRADARVWASQLDVRDAASVTARVEEAASRLGGLELAVNNAGVSSMKRVVDLTEDDWDFNMDINAKGIFLCCQAELRYFLRQGRRDITRSIVNTASMAGKKAAPLLAHYSASKFAVIGFTQALALETAADGIRVNAVCPGYVRTAFSDNAVRGDELKKVRPASVRGITAERVARATLRGYLKQKREVIVPWTMHVPVKIYQLFPSVVEWAMERMAK